MKWYKKLLLLCVLSTLTFGADLELETPSSMPIDTFQMQDNQIGIGYILSSATLELEDSYYDDKIGDVEYDTKGLIVTLPANTNFLFGKIFEFSITGGIIDSKLKDKTFKDSGYTYNNKYDKSGYYIGVRPAFSADIYDSDMFKFQNVTTLHLMLYHLDGSFAVHRTGAGNNNYAYDETNTGLALKPTVIFNGTFFPIKNLGISAFGGFSTLLDLDYCDYSNKTNSFDSDTEVEFLTSSIDPVYGFDIIFRGIFKDYDALNLSSVFTPKEVDTSIETVVRYIISF